MTEQEGTKLVKVPPERRRKKTAPPAPAAPPESEASTTAEEAPQDDGLERVVGKHLKREEQEQQQLDEEVEDLSRRPDVYAGSSPVPPVETEPERRPMATMGSVRFTEAAGVPDLVEGGRKPRTLEDLLSMFPIGDGQYRIRVERKKPKEWGGYPCMGVQKSIRRPLSTEQFRREYGGGEYQLVVYGPPRRGGQYDPATRKLREKALTEEIPLTLSWAPPYGVPPQPDAAFDPEEESAFWESENEADMLYAQPFRPTGRMGMGSATPADAKIHESDLQHEREMADRRAAQEREMREEAARTAANIHPVLETVQASNFRMFELLRERDQQREASLEQERNDERRRRLEAEQRQQQMAEEERKRIADEAKKQREEMEKQRAELETRPTRPGEFAEAMSKLMVPVFETMKEQNKPRDDGAMQAQLQAANQRLESQMQAHAAQIERLTSQHRDELIRLQNNHKDERDRERTLHDEEMKRERAANETNVVRERRMAEEMMARADRRAQEAEARVTEAERKLEERLERARKEEREAADKRVADTERVWKDRMADEQRNHDREIRSLEATYQTRNQTDKSIAENTTQLLRSEVERERIEKARYQQEATEKGDVVAQVGKIAAVAEQLGYSKNDAAAAEGPQDWKTMVFQMGMHLAQNLPDIISKAGEAVEKAKRPRGAETPQLATPGYAPPMLPAAQFAPPMMGPPPMAFSMEDGMPMPPVATTREARYPTRSGMPAGAVPIPPPVMNTIGSPVPPMQPPPPMPVAAPHPMGPLSEQMAPSVAPTAPVLRRPPRPAAPPPEPPAPETPKLQIPDEQILMFRPVFEEALSKKMPPEEFAQALMQEHGRDIVVAIGASLSPARITGAILKQPDGPRSPLVRKDGQQYLKAIFAAVNQLGATA